MSAQKGSELLIKLENDASPPVFTTIAGLRTKSFQLNDELVDVTNSDSLDKWRELLEGAGIKSMSVSGSGVFTDETVHATLVALKMAGTHRAYQVVVPGLGTFEGQYQINPLGFGGEHNAEVTYEFGLESAGKIAFTGS